MTPSVGNRYQHPTSSRLFVVIAVGVSRARIRYEDDATEAVADLAFFDQTPIPA